MPDIPLLSKRTLFNTGDSLSGTTSVWCFNVPDDDWIQEAFTQVLTMLTIPENWQQQGEALVEDAVSLFSTMVKDGIP